MTENVLHQSSGPNETVLLLHKLLVKVLPVTTFYVCNSHFMFYFMLYILVPLQSC